jgi:hypothetical protein
LIFVFKKAKLLCREGEGNARMKPFIAKIEHRVRAWTWIICPLKRGAVVKDRSQLHQIKSCLNFVSGSFNSRIHPEQVKS